MFRTLAVALLVSCFAATGWAQSPSTSPAPPAPIKPAAKKAAPKAKATVKPPVAAETGPCRLGVISVLGNQFAVQKFGVTPFEYEGADVQIDWGLDDLVFARVRVATGNDPAVRRISYPKNAFDPLYHPKPHLLPDPSEDLPAIVQSFTSNANCDRYLVVTKFRLRPQNTNLDLNGIGTYNQGLGSMLRHSHVFANVALTLLDGRSYARIDRTLVNMRNRFSEGMRMTENPLKHLDNSDFPAPPAAAASSATLREKARGLVAEQLDQALPDYLKGE
ncbi:hypothetical protein HAP48_0016240 [Bradyrhizobium septentrionale]|uniref:hypothetical protein n=1 Tax=Bradyrhizobium septentrionale TaxID=1404411 RepID=UPI001AEEB591|nr:hypothetical protein [Bradyrhizobium septentrionale]UGY18863.1 hypothetical protein HAP48_0016240 [Bradyrhizobium septentrionale]UGY27593.1 hypothetical protein HU675_0012985 [Bradyrhizobium septentrionale]